MPLLRGSDSRALLALAGDVAECETAAQLEAQIAVGLPRVIGADAVMVTACRDWGDEVELEVGDRDVYCAELLAAIGTRWREHPVLTRDLARANSAPRRLSDFLSGRDWRRRGLFNDFYRPLGMTRELAVQLSWGPAGSSCCAALHRDGSDFSERDRLALALVAPHLRAARARIAARVSLDRRLALLEHGIEDMRGALVVGSGDTSSSRAPTPATCSSAGSILARTRCRAIWPIGGPARGRNPLRRCSRSPRASAACARGSCAAPTRIS